MDPRNELLELLLRLLGGLALIALGIVLLFFTPASLMRVSFYWKVVIGFVGIVCIVLGFRMPDPS